MTTAVFLIVYHMVKNHVIIFKFTITENFWGEAGVFGGGGGGEASPVPPPPPPPPIDETLSASQGCELVLFQIEAFRTYGEWPDKQGVRISGGPHLGVPLYVHAITSTFLVINFIYPAVCPRGHRYFIGNVRICIQ